MKSSRCTRLGWEAGKCKPANRIVVMAAVFLATVVFPSAAASQIDNASLFVRVVGQNDDPLPGVAIEVLDPSTGLARTAVTGSSGQVLLRALPPGDYRVTAELDDMSARAQRNLTLRVGQRAQLELALELQVAETLAITSEPSLVDVFRMDSSTNVIPEQIEALPVRDRQYERLAFLTPGTQKDRGQYFNRTGSPVVGASPDGATVAYLMDGADFTDNFFGLGRVRVSQDAIEEFRVLSHRFDTEIGGSAGGAISVVTKSGSNLRHGSAFGFYRADSMRSTGALEENDLDFTRYHLGLTAGGPIVEDKTHYFLSVEHIDQTDASFFRPGGAFAHLAEDVPHPLKQELVLTSIDHQFTPASSGIGRLVAEEYREENYQVGRTRDRSRGWSVNRDHFNALVGHTWVLGQGRLNEVRLQIGGDDSEWPKNSTARGESFRFGNTLITGRDWTGENRGRSRLVELRDTFHWMQGERHQLKTGLSYQLLRRDYLWEAFDAGAMSYMTDDRSRPFLYLYGDGSSQKELDCHLIGAFAQDDWIISDGLAVSLGLRYDVDIGGNNPDFEHPLQPEARGTDWDNLQPRMGFSWDLDKDGVHILRGGAGIFHGRYTASPSFSELQFDDVRGRRIETRLNGLLAGLDPPDNLWLDVDDPRNTGVRLPLSIYPLGESFRNPESTQTTLGYSRRLGRSNLRVDIEGIYVDGRNEVLQRDANWAGNDNPGRINPDYTTIGELTDAGRSTYKALVLGLNGTTDRGHVIASSLTLADKNNLQDDGSSVPSDPADIEAEWGSALTDERYRLVVSGVFRLPRGFLLAPFYEYGSGQPWNRRYGYDFNGDLENTDRPPGVGRNDADGPPFRQLSLRLSRAVSLGEDRDLELILEAFNVLDTVNYDVNSVDGAMYFRGPTLSNPNISFVPNPGFGQYRATHPPREIQLGARYRF